MLTDDELRMLRLERSWWKVGGSKENAIRKEFGLSPTHYYQTLNALIDREDAYASDPMLIQRLRRLRTTRLKGVNDA